MAFVLGLWDADRPPGVAEARQRHDQLSRGQDPAEVASDRVTAFLNECSRRWPGGDEVPAPYESRRTATGFVATIPPDAAGALYGAWGEMAERHGLVMYDPQSGIIKIPSRLSFDARPPVSTRGWFGRKP